MIRQEGVTAARDTVKGQWRGLNSYSEEGQEDLSVRNLGFNPGRRQDNNGMNRDGQVRTKSRFWGGGWMGKGKGTYSFCFGNVGFEMLVENATERWNMK